MFNQGRNPLTRFELSSHWHVSDSLTTRTIYRSRHKYYTLFRKAGVLVFLIVAMVLLVWAWKYPPSRFDPLFVRIAVGFVVVLLTAGLLGELRGDLVEITLSKDTVKIRRAGLISQQMQVLSAHGLQFVYAQHESLSSDSGAVEIVLGYNDTANNASIEVTDTEDRKLLARLIRDYYRLSEYPASDASHTRDICCLKCRYDLRGSVIADASVCPECGSEIEPWQIRDWKSGLNKSPAMKSERSDK